MAANTTPKHDSSKPTAPVDKAALSEREIEILRLVATGASNKQIAQQLVISTNTVKVHLRNIFAKIGVASRTEATVYAIRAGLSDMPAVAADNLPLPMIVEAGQARDEDGREMPTAELETLAPPSVVAAPLLPTEAAQPISTSRQPWQHAGWLILAVSLALLGVFGLRQLVAAPALPAASPTASPAATATPTAPRWQTRAPLPVARRHLAVTTYENQIYAIGGETVEGVTGQLDRYDPATDSWTTLTAKSLAVSEVGASVIGGRIYVPGGRLASGRVTDALEVYDHRTDRWEQRARLPVAVSAYALVAFEGRLYLFGGWDGSQYLASTYAYDPTRDVWTERTPMPTARGYAGAAVAGGRIYVIGGAAGGNPLTINEEYTPEAEQNATSPWRVRTPLLAGRFQMGIASIADIVHVVGGGPASAQPIEYFPQSDQWQAFETPGASAWSGLGLAVVETEVYAIGGQLADMPTAENWAYQAIYTLAIPVIQLQPQ